MGLGTDLTGRLLLLDALEMEWHTMKFRRDPRCPVCGPLVAAAPAAVAG
jgi:molybdopterin-synthase adenylyltransferase